MSGAENLSGRRIGRYAVLRHLATGGMADIYIARQEGVGGFEKDLVLKVVKSRYAEHPRVVQMFLDEARLAAKLNHPNIVHVYDVGDADGLHYIAMEHIHGETVADIVRRGTAVDRYPSLEISTQIVAESAAGLAYAHEAGIVHRDISPSNLLVSYEGQTKIVDFGIARAGNAITDDSTVRAGKVAYMSPEQARNEPVDGRSDLFALGIVFYEITLGRRLFRGQPKQVLNRLLEETIPPPTYYRRDYPPALEQIVMKLLEKRPADRFQSAAALCQELEQFLEEQRLRTSNLRLSQYLRELFAPEVPLSADGVARARQLEQLGSQSGGVVAEDSEELDFDRRAPMRLRMTAMDQSSGNSSRTVDGAAATVERRSSGSVKVVDTAGAARRTPLGVSEVPGRPATPPSVVAQPLPEPAVAAKPGRAEREELRTLGVTGRPRWVVPAVLAALACAGVAVVLFLR